MCNTCTYQYAHDCIIYIAPTSTFNVAVCLIFHSLLLKLVVLYYNQISISCVFRFLAVDDTIVKRTTCTNLIGQNDWRRF